jgi:uncharacterized membrane protein YeaQ/YmgE (transglycosylase-associated protein family)
MDVILLLGAMIIVGLVIGWVAGLIWKENRPFGVRGDYVIAILAAVATGLLDWYVIPAMGFSDTLKWLGVASEPPLVALAALWIARKAKE